jgi:hypothetical protein
MTERWHPQSEMSPLDEDRCFVTEYESAVRHNRKACFQLLKRLQREGPDPYAVVTRSRSCHVYQGHTETLWERPRTTCAQSARKVGRCAGRARARGQRRARPGDETLVGW